jgi:hypothetical protein
MRRLWVVLVIGLYGVLAVECRPHPLGPARSGDAYKGKATATIESALAEVQTARLTARIAGHERGFTPYLSVTLSDAEDSLGGLQGTFDSIQPPGGMDAFRQDVDKLLADALEHTTDVRIAARRGTTRDLAVVARPLDEDAQALQRFLEENGAA